MTKTISTAKTYADCRCQVCGDQCASHPYYCERHRPPRERNVSSKFAKGIMHLGKWQPVLMEDVELLTRSVENQGASITMTGTMMRARKLYKGMDFQTGRVFKEAKFIPLYDGDPSSKEIVMAGVVLMVNSWKHQFCFLSYRYEVRLDITEWYLKEG